MMGSIKHSITLVSLLLLGILSFAIGTRSSDGFFSFSCASRYNATSIYKANVKALLSYLISNATVENGFYSTIVGWGTAYSISGRFLCRGDVTPSTCQHCVTFAANQTLEHCPEGTEFTAYNDLCTLSYTNQSFKPDSLVPNTVSWKTANKTEISDSQLDHFNNITLGLFRDLAKQAANSSGSGGKKFATEEVNFTSTRKVYGLAQCMPDLEAWDCTRCFEKAFEELRGCCEYWREVPDIVRTCCDKGSTSIRIVVSGCNMRYEMYPFYNVTKASLAIANTPHLRNKKDSGARTVIMIVVPTVVSVMLFCLGCLLLMRRQTRKTYKAAWKEWKHETALQVLDPCLIESCCETEVTKCLQIGLLCVQENPDDRPTIAKVVSYLDNVWVELPVPTEPAFFMHARHNPNIINPGSGQPNSQSPRPSSLNEISKSELWPR
ncbi:cysteine-rich receptor-like protein kinase 10 [Senna tora]|uniref:Cysteine-rich receptor-like protein kinase 10 n=1 Tax=Senna tora TaxID=362788 RepID=A0A834SXC9_9FABA|nr:cysteine-rich receptor-like protein kinase 10 [Senna tora]